jgi:molybdate transport system regulatory protein
MNEPVSPPTSPPDANDVANAPTRDPLALRGSLWLHTGGETLAGATRIALLAAIGETGSITGAAKTVGLSYKAAWEAVDAMNNVAGVALVERATGGKGGGGTTLTPRAHRLIETYRVLEREHRKFIERASAAIEDFAGNLALIGRIGMKTSARNQLYGTVHAVTRGSVNDEVTVKLPGGQQIVAVLTHESTETLGLAVGKPAFALVKASWIVLAVDDSTGSPPLRVSTRNQLRGTVKSVSPGAVNAEVALELANASNPSNPPGSLTGPVATTVVTAIVTNESVTALDLAPGKPAIALFKASSVILGTTD